MRRKKLTPLEQEKQLDQDEIIDFEYFDKLNNRKVVIHDKRKIKVALMEMDEFDKKQKDEIARNECPYNSRTDDPVEEQDFDLEYEPSEFELSLEDALQEACNKIYEMREKSQIISKIFKNHFKEFTFGELFTIFLYYYLDFSKSEIAKIFGLNRSTIGRDIAKIITKLRKFADEI